MSSKSRNGLSRREYAAKQAGGKLNYKTGKISVPKKSKPKSLSGAGPLLPGQERVSGSYTGDQMQNDPTLESEMGDLSKWTPEYGRASDSEVSSQYQTKSKSYDKNKSKAKKVVTPSQRESASIAFNEANPFKIATAEASSGKPSSASHQTNLMGNIVSSIGKAAIGVPGQIYKTVTGHNVDLGLTELLGMSKNSPGADAMTFDTGNTLSNYGNMTADQPTSVDSSGTLYYNGYDPATRSLPTPAQDVQTPNDVLNLGQGPINYPGVTGGTTWNQPTNRNRTPSPVNQPFIPAPNIPTSSISSAYQEPQVIPDYTPVQSEQGTKRQFLGNGYLSNGIASNGKGDYGIEGAMTGTNQDQNNLFNDMFGVNTAMAAEPQQSMFTQNTSLPWQKPAVPYAQSQEYRDIMNHLYSMPDDSSTQTKDQPPLTGGGTTGGYTPPTQNAQMQGFDNSGYKDAMKAQKKALDELIKSIKNQYKQSTTEGTTALDKSKQQDLLKLSGLFSFANQDPNSEQRMQYEQRTQNDYAGQLTDLLNKLAQGQTKDISSAKTNYQSSLADIMQQQAQAKQAYQNQVMQQMANKIK